MMSTLVTVLIPFYNPGRYLAEAVESVFQQIYTDWKLILIDDGSTENYKPQIAEHLKDPRVKLVRLPENSGQSAALNKGLDLAETPFIVQLDSDDWFYPHTLQVLVNETFNQPEDVGIFSGNIHVIQEDAEGNRMMSVVHHGRSFSDKYDFLLANTSVWPRFYRTSAIRSIGGWPTDDPYNGRVMEDKRVLLRMIEQFKFHWVDQMLYNHRRHSGNHTNQIGLYAEMVEWAIRDALKRWGDQYEPVIVTYGQGWKRLERLIGKNAETVAPIPSQTVPPAALVSPEPEVIAGDPVLPPASPDLEAVAEPVLPLVATVPAVPVESAPAAASPVLPEPIVPAVPVVPAIPHEPAPPSPPMVVPAVPPPVITTVKAPMKFGPGTAPYTGPGTAPGTGPGTLGGWG